MHLLDCIMLIKQKQLCDHMRETWEKQLNHNQLSLVTADIWIYRSQNCSLNPTGGLTLLCRVLPSCCHGTCVLFLSLSDTLSLPLLFKGLTFKYLSFLATSSKRLHKYLRGTLWASQVSSSSAKSSDTFCYQPVFQLRQKFEFWTLGESPDPLHQLCYCGWIVSEWTNVLRLGCTSSLFSFTLSPAETSSLTSPLLSFSHTHSATHSQQDGCLFNPKPLMESAYCLWSTYSQWANFSQLRPLCFFSTPAPAWKSIAWSGQVIKQSLVLSDYAYDYTFPLASCFFQVSWSGVMSTWMVLLYSLPLEILAMIWSWTCSFGEECTCTNLCCSIFYRSHLRLVSLNNLLSHNGKLPPNDHQYLTVWHPPVPI